MYRQILLAQWRWSKQAVLTFAVLAFAAPLFTVFYRTSSDESQVRNWLLGAERVGMAMPVLALLLGVFLGMAAWAADHSGKHVYALSLPVPRWHLVLLRFAAGVTLLTLPVAGLAAGAALATAVVELPEGVHAYPVQLTLRFALACLLCFAVFFALSIATRRVVLSLLGLAGGLLLADVLLGALSQDTIVTETVLTLFTTWPGPLVILAGRWALFDV